MKQNECIEEITVRTETIRLQDFLKFSSAVGSGGEAKLLVQNGDVKVNGETETRRGRKLRPGDVVEVGGKLRKVIADGAS